MKITLAALAAFGMAAGAASAISLGQINDFEGGTTEGWSHGAPSPNPPVVVTEDSNTFLRVVSTGMGGPGSRMAMYNRTPGWLGDYLAAGVSQVQFDVRNSGDTALNVRIGLLNTFGQIGVTNGVIELEAGSGWVTATLDLANLTVIGAPDTESILENVFEMRFLSVETPAYEGDFIAGSMDLDNIRARAFPAPGGAALFGVAGLAGLRRRR